MRHFFRGGRGMAVGQSDKVTELPSDKDLSSRPVLQNSGIPTFRSDERSMGCDEVDRDFCICPDEHTPTVYQLSSAQDLPWFYLCSASPRSAYDRAVTRLRSFIGAPSQSYRSVIGAVSEKGRTWLGLGRVLVGINAGTANAIFRPISTTLRTFFALSPSFHRVGIEWASNWNRVYPMNILCLPVFDIINYRKRTEDNVSESIQRPAGAFLMDNRKITVKREGQLQTAPSHTLAMTCLYTGYEQETPKNRTRNYQETYRDCTRMKQETPKRETRKWRSEGGGLSDRLLLSLGRYRSDEVVLGDLKLPERYCKGTGKVLKSGGKGTGEVLESYQRGTKEVLTGSRSVVALEGDGGISVRHRAAFRPVGNRNEMERSDLLDRLPRFTRSDDKLVYDFHINRLVLKGFRVRCEDFRGEVASILDKTKINEQRGLKCFGGFVAAKTKLEPIGEGCFGFAQHDVHGGGEQVLGYGSRFNFQILPDSSGQAGTSGTKRGDVLGGLKLIALMIFCVFSNPDLLGTSAMAQSPTKVGAVAKVKQEISTKGLVIGDSLPDWFWEQELQVVNHPQKSKTIKLSAYRQQLLVLDFLNTACVPCIKSVDKWNELQPDYKLEVSVLPIHLYGDNARISPFAEQRGWEMPIAVGNRADTLINQLFYVRRSFGQVWIKDGRLLAIPHNKDVSRSLIGKALTRRDLGIQMNDMLTYFDRRYYIKEEE